MSASTKSITQVGVLRPFTFPEFLLLWVGESISTIGDQAYLVALPWFVLQLTGSTLALGAVMMTATIPRALFMLLGGVASDRLSPRSIMLLSDGIRAIVTSAMTGLVVFHRVRVWHLYSLSFLLGFIEAFFIPAYTKMVPWLVDKDVVDSANALMRGTTQLIILAVPASIGLLVSHGGVQVAFAVDAASFLVAIAALSRLQDKGLSVRNTDPLVVPSGNKAQGVLADLCSGLKYAVGNRSIRAVLLVYAVARFAFAGPFVLGSAMLARQKFVQGAAALGIILSAMGAGAITGAFSANSIRRSLRLGKLLIAVSFGFAIGTALFPFLPSLWAVSALAAAMGFAASVTNVATISWLQLSTDSAMTGRVLAVAMFCTFAVQPFSYLLAGLLANTRVELMFLVASSLILATAIASLSSRTVNAIK